MKRFMISTLLLATCAGTLASAIEARGASKDERVSMRIYQTTPIIFPRTMLERGITSGAARVALSLDHTGQLTDLLVIGHTGEAFAEAAERGIRSWRFDPMRVGGDFVATQATLAVDFRAEGVVISIDSSTDLQAHLLSFRRGTVYEPCPLQKLDAIPTPLEFVEPAYSQDLVKHGVVGEAVIEFYIDENGSVRVPAVTDADFWELGVLAMSAVRQWRFTPPTSRGKPVLIHVRQVFHFGSDVARNDH